MFGDSGNKCKVITKPRRLNKVGCDICINLVHDAPLISEIHSHVEAFVSTLDPITIKVEEEFWPPYMTLNFQPLKNVFYNRKGDYGGL